MQFFDICSKTAQLLLPQNCLLCGSTCGWKALCADCLTDLPALTTACCPVCALPAQLGEICGQCLQHSPHFDATIAAFSFDFPTDALIRALKYQGQLEIAVLLGELLALRLTHYARPDIVIPMPLHASRLKQRGFNQAAEIARPLARSLDLPLALGTAVRTRATEPQAGQPLNARKKNMRGTFSVARDIAGKNIAIVDDVMTTGTSLNELAKALKAAGAARVECWVVVRTLKV